MTSIENGEVTGSRRDRAAGAAGAAFLALLLLAVVWPSPVHVVNQTTLKLPLDISERSFLGREAPAWDMIYWSIAGLYVIALVHGRTGQLAVSWRAYKADFRAIPGRLAERLRELSGRNAALFAVLSVGAIAAVWTLLDLPLLGLSYDVRSDVTRAAVGVFNRLGGGMNPVMVIGFFALAGMVFAMRRWWLYSISMMFAGALGGLLVQATKYVVGRSRPEIWYGPFHYVDGPSSSFPSGHTVGVFAILGPLMFGSRSPAVRAMSFLVAAAVGLSRILAFRHWPSDVLASAILGSALAWFFVTAMLKGAEDDL